MNGAGRLLSCVAVAAFAAGLGNAGAEGLLGAKPQAAPTAPKPDQPPTASSLATPAPTGSPSAVVRPFYAEGGADLAAADRNRFIDPAKTVLEKNEALKKSGQGDCLDQNMPLDEVSYDKAALDKSFKSLESVTGDDARVVVAFVEGSDPHRLEWKLKKVGGEWKISDLLSVTGEWALSQYQCE